MIEDIQIVADDVYIYVSPDYYIELLKELSEVQMYTTGHSTKIEHVSSFYVEFPFNGYSVIWKPYID